MKRSVSLLFVILLILSMFTFAMAQETSDGFQYRIEKDGFATITGYSGAGGELLIPSEVEGKAVTKIGNGAFVQNKTITHVLLPEGITQIGDGAFRECSEIVSIELPHSLSVLGEASFKGCAKLQYLNIPEGVIDIPANALSNTSKIEVLTLPSTIKLIGDDALSYTGFKNIILPNSLNKIGDSAFRSSKLESITIPNSVSVISELAFWDCKKLTKIILPTGLKKIGQNMFYNDILLEKVAIPKGVTNIHSNVFGNCYKVSIWGFKGSTAETYAKKNDIPFVTVEPIQEVRLLLNEENITGEKLYIDLSTDINTVSLNALTSPESPWPDVTWKSSDNKTAAVDASGLVTGLKKGKVMITATAVDGSGKKTVCEVNIAYLTKEIQITGEETVKAGKKIKLTATVLPETTSNKKLDWTTSDKTIATVEANGTVTAKKLTEEQTVTISATSKDDSGVSAEFVIKVIP